MAAVAAIMAGDSRRYIRDVTYGALASRKISGYQMTCITPRR
jgi:hypothetical protein